MDIFQIPRNLLFENRRSLTEFDVRDERSLDSRIANLLRSEFSILDGFFIPSLFMKASLNSKKPYIHMASESENCGRFENLTNIPRPHRIPDKAKVIFSPAVMPR
jgi:hypothetical protein